MLKRKRSPANPIQEANLVSDEKFVDDYLQPEDGWTQWTHPKTQEKHSIALLSPDKISQADMSACFRLVEETSRKDYEPSSLGWQPGAKKAEMKSPELRYLLVRDAAAADGRLVGFASLMPTFEEGRPCVYCYEVHLRPEMRGTGLGKLLMGYLERVATNIDTAEKVMLTCFVSNAAAMGFYRRLGFVEDESSPRARRLRGGRIREPDYMVMSKAVPVNKEAAAGAGAAGVAGEAPTPGEGGVGA